jgi:hypothetical protein
VKVKTVEGSRERRILTAMIVDRTVLGRIVPKWHKDLFSSPYASVVGQWCVDHFQKYGKAPGKGITPIFEDWSENQDDRDTVRLVEQFLSGLSREYASLKKEINPDLIMDLAGAYFNEVALKRLSERIEATLEMGKPEKAIEAVTKFHQVEIGAGAGTLLFSSEDRIESVFENKSKPVVEYEGALGEFFGDTLERDGFISFEGPEKSGKTFWLLDVAWRAVEQGRKVVFFEIGDLSENQILLRFAVRAAKWPAKPTAPGKKVNVPTFIEVEQQGDESKVEVTAEEKVYETGLGPKRTKKALARMKEKYGSDALIVSTHANGTIGIAGISSILDGYRLKGWEPDVIVIDYADLLIPPPGYQESRDQVNANWKAMRGLSQKLHCLLVTASQTNADSYDAETITRRNFSEDKRKRAHTTGTVGINYGDKDKKRGAIRLNWIVRRESDFRERECVFVAPCLALANPAVCSSF